MSRFQAFLMISIFAGGAFVIAGCSSGSGWDPGDASTDSTTDGDTTTDSLDDTTGSDTATDSAEDVDADAEEDVPPDSVDLCDGVDCSGLDDQCNAGVCDPATGDCVADPLEDGTTCDDADPCTVGDQCTDGVCGGGPMDCTDLDDQCNLGACDPATGSCVADPTSLEGSTCDDEDPCTVDDECADGVCGGGPMDCTDLDDQCNIGTCDPTTGTCVADGTTLEGSSCDDADGCTVDDQCTDGVCGGDPMDCSHLDDQCTLGVCDPATTFCVGETATLDGSTCDDADGCTVDDQCADGICGGDPMDCTYLDDQCNIGFCDPATETCVADTATLEGSMCDDADGCTVDDQCTGGTCGGDPVIHANDTCTAPEALPAGDGFTSVSGSTLCATDAQQGSCHAAGGADLVYSFELDAPRRVTLETVPPSTGTGYNTALHVRTECTDPTTEVACDDDAVAGGFSFIDADLDPGTYHVFVDGASGTDSGDFELEVEIHAPEACDDAALLTIPAPGDIAFVEGSTSGAANDFTSTCAASAGSPDHVYEFDVTERSHLIFETLIPGTGRYDTALHLRGSPCVEGAGTTIACNDDGGDGTLSRLDVTLDPGTYYIIVDGYSSTNSGSYLLQVSNASRGLVGDAVLIGHDYYASNASQDLVVGNAVFLAHTDGEVSVLAYTQYADTATGGEVENTDAAIDARAATLGRTWVKEELTDHTQLASTLPGHHVLLVYEQESASSGETTTVGSDWSATLSSFVNDGGVVVVCDYSGATWQVMNSSGLMDITGYSGITGAAVTVVAPTDEVATDLPASYPAGNGSNSYTTTETSVVVESGGGDPVVIHNRFGVRAGADFYALPYDFYEWDAAVADLLDRAVQYGFSSTPVVGAVRECVDTTGSTSSSSPGGSYNGEYNATIAALEYAGFPPANIIEIADAADAAAQAGTYDVLLFMEAELCSLDSGAWTTVVNDLMVADGRVVVTTSRGNMDTFVTGLGFFGSGSRASVSTPYSAASDPFWAGITHPGSMNATDGWTWAGSGLIPLGYSSDGTTLTVWGYDI